MHSIVEFCFPLNLVLRTVFGQNFLNITITLRKKLIRDFNSLSVKTDARALLLDNSNFDNAYSRNLFHLIVARGAVFRKRGIWTHLRSIQSKQLKAFSYTLTILSKNVHHRCYKVLYTHLFKPFHVTGLFLYALKTSENLQEVQKKTSGMKWVNSSK